MIYDKKTLRKCSIEQLEQFEQEHKEEIQNIISLWFAIDYKKLVYTRENVDYEWKIKSASHRLLNIQKELSIRFEITD